MDEKLVAELKKQGRGADRVDKDRADALRLLVKSPGWAVYVDLIDKRIQLHGDTILMPAETSDQCMVLEGLKGTMRGLIMARNLPSAIIQGAEEIPTQSDEESAK